MDDLERLDHDLRAAVARSGMAAKLRRDIDWLQRALEAAAQRSGELERQLNAERRDIVRATEGLTAMWYRLLGDHEERVERERADELRVAVLYRGVVEDIAYLTAERERLSRRLADLGDAFGELDQAIAAKERALIDAGGDIGEELAALAHEAGTLEEQQREIDEALDVGDIAAAEVHAALSELRSAESWGLFDIVAGGIIVSMLKHDRIARAQSTIARAQHALYAFHRELDDVTLSTASAAGLHIGEVAFVFDVLFDNIFSDFFVQAKIGDSLEAVASVRAALDSTRAALQQAGEDSRWRLQLIVTRRRDLVSAA